MNCLRHRVKKQVKSKVECVVLTFCTLFSQVPAQEPKSGKALRHRSARWRDARYQQSHGECRIRSLVRLSIRDRDVRSVARRIAFWSDYGKSSQPRSERRTGCVTSSCGFGCNAAVPPLLPFRVKLAPVT